MIDTDNFVEYITVQGDRLDTIARKHYGDPTSWGPIIEANPTVPILRSYTAGLKFRIPVLTLRNDAVTRTELPPWKQ